MQIEAHDLSFEFENNSVLENISLEIRKGEFIGIIGPNGGGKTTLLKCLMGFLKPIQGKVCVRGRIGYVPQVQKVDREFPITLHELVLMGALETVDFWGRYPEAAKQKAEKLMGELNLWEHREKVFGSLSGGMAQKALLARALMSDPEVLILDEPTANIDGVATKVILEMLQRLKRDKTILMVTHDLKTIIESVDRILCLQKSLTIFSPSQVCEHFALGLYHTPLLSVPNHHFAKEESDLALYR